MKRIFLTLLTLMTGLISLHAQSVKDVMQDKKGKYLYAQSRDSDIKVAFEIANRDLLKEVNDWCKAKGITPPEDIADVQAHIHRINGEVLGQHRVFLFVTTESLTEGISSAGHEETAESPEVAVADNHDDSAPSGLQNEAADEGDSPLETEVMIAADSEDLVVPELDEIQDGGEISSDEAVEFVTDSQSTPDSDLSLPSGRIGDIVKTLLGCTSDSQILQCLAKEKTTRGISKYGKGDTKYARYCYLVRCTGGRVRVISPELSDGSRIDYTDGTTVESPRSIAGYYWFLKK